MQPGDEITVRVDELVAGGDSLARVEGLPVFTPNLYPGDTAVIRLTEVKKGFARGEVVEVTSPSARRRAQPCPVADECGGCDWTALRLDAQLEAKKRILTESLRRIGKFDPAALPPIDVHASPLNYRIRSRLHRDGGVTGFYAMRTNRVVQLPPECEVVGVATARKFGGPDDSRRSSGALLWHPDNSVSAWEIEGHLLTADAELTIGVDDYTYHLSTHSFFQVNRHLLGTMLRLVAGHADRCTRRNVALDLYSGVGFFTAPLADRFDHVIAVEGFAESARYARMNAAPNVQVIEAPVELHPDKLPDADFIFLDPPRAGARREVVSAAGRNAREMVCYLSCDPVTFSRDANRLTASGWRLSSLDLLDLFPNTHHVETLASFERAG